MNALDPLPLLLIGYLLVSSCASNVSDQQSERQETTVTSFEDLSTQLHEVADAPKHLDQPDQKLEEHTGQKILLWMTFGSRSHLV